MEFVDYYKIMGLDDTASADEIKRKYRKLARKYHPDVSEETNSEARFKEVGEAYQVLKDPERRREYDELRQYGGAAPADFRPPPGWQTHAGFDPGDLRGTEQYEFSDFFEQLFGARSGDRTSPQAEQNVSLRGQDIHTNLSVSLHDAFHGSSVSLSLRTPVYHTDGSIRTEQKTLQVKIPSGIVEGQRLRLRGQGGPGIGGGDTGDLYIQLSIKSDDRFHLDGKNVTFNLPVCPWEAALGAVVQVPTLDGAVNLTIPANATAGQKLRLKGRGMPGEPAGDQLVMLTIVAPKATTDEQKEIYKKMSSLWSFNPREKSE
jgi:curved DNA-binding protein